MREKDVDRAIQLLRMAEELITDGWVGMIPYTDEQSKDKHIAKECASRICHAMEMAAYLKARLEVEISSPSPGKEMP